MLRRVEAIDAHNLEIDRISKERAGLVDQMAQMRGRLTAYRARVRGIEGGSGRSHVVASLHVHPFPRTPLSPQMAELAAQAQESEAITASTVKTAEQVWVCAGAFVWQVS